MSTSGQDRAGARGPDNPAARYGSRMGARSSSAALQARLIKQERTVLDQLFDEIQAEDSVARVAAVLAGARRRFISGAGRSAAFAHLLDLDLSHGVPHVTHIDGTTVRPLDVLPDIRATDALIVFAMRRYRRETVQLAEQFAERGAQVVAVTDAADSPVLQFAAEHIIVPTASASVTDSATGVVAVIHLLTALTTASSKGSRRRLAEREDLIEQMGLYI